MGLRMDNAYRLTVPLLSKKSRFVILLTTTLRHRLPKAGLNEQMAKVHASRTHDIHES